MELNHFSLRCYLNDWKVGTWYQRLAYWLIHKNRYKIYYDSNKDSIYLLRMYIFGSADTKLSLWLHFFPRGDKDHYLHDHPFFFISYVVAGSYFEELLRGWTLRKKGSLVFRTAHALHRVHTNYAWTIVLRGPKVKTWGFLVKGKMVPWRTFLGLPSTVKE